MTHVIKLIFQDLFKYTSLILLALVINKLLTISHFFKHQHAVLPFSTLPVASKENFSLQNLFTAI